MHTWGMYRVLIFSKYASSVFAQSELDGELGLPLDPEKSILSAE